MASRARVISSDVGTHRRHTPARHFHARAHARTQPAHAQTNAVFTPSLALHVSRERPRGLCDILARVVVHAAPGKIQHSRAAHAAAAARASQRGRDARQSVLALHSRHRVVRQLVDHRRGRPGEVARVDGDGYAE